MHSTPARTAHRGRAALIGWFKALMTVAGIVLSCWALAVGASVVAAPPYNNFCIGIFKLFLKNLSRGVTIRSYQIRFSISLVFLNIKKQQL